MMALPAYASLSVLFTVLVAGLCSGRPAEVPAPTPARMPLKTKWQLPYDSNIFIGDPDMYLPYHPCDYERCGENQVCTVNPGYATAHHNVACKPRCIPVQEVITNPHLITRECRYIPHATVPKVNMLHCNCRTKCVEKVNPVPVCGSDGRTYRSYCYLQTSNCANETGVLPVSLGACPETKQTEKIRNCTPSLYVTRVTLSFNYVRLLCLATDCQEAGEPVWYKQEVLNGFPLERRRLTMGRERSTQYYMNGASLFAIFGAREADTGMYTCEIPTASGNTYYGTKQVIIQKPDLRSEYLQRKHEYEEKLKILRRGLY